MKIVHALHLIIQGENATLNIDSACSMITDNPGGKSIIADDSEKVYNLNTRDKFLSLKLSFIVGSQVRADTGAHP